MNKSGFVPRGSSASYRANSRNLWVQSTRDAHVIASEVEKSLGAEYSRPKKDASAALGMTRVASLGMTRGTALGVTRGAALGVTRGAALGVTRGAALDMTRGASLSVSPRAGCFYRFGSV